MAQLQSVQQKLADGFGGVGTEWIGNGGGGPVTAGSPEEEDRMEEVAKARGSGWTG